MNEKRKSRLGRTGTAFRRAPAFTLIELLFVVATIAILAAIAVPNFLEAQVRSKVARSLDDLHALGAALEAYFIEQRAYPPNLATMVIVRSGAPIEAGGRAPVLFHRIELSDNRWLCETSESLRLRTGWSPAAPANPPSSPADAGAPMPPPRPPGPSPGSGVPLSYTGAPILLPPTPAPFGEYPLSYNGIALTRLTTPVPYLGSFPTDPFFPRGYARAYAFRNQPPGAAAPTSATAPRFIDWTDVAAFGYCNFTAVEPDGLSIPAFGRSVTYVLTSVGPDRAPSFTDPAQPFPAIYDPTNGIPSAGDLVLPGSQ